jgi:hypothetical protein
MFRLSFNITNNFNQKWSIIILSANVFACIIALIAGYIINRTYQSCFISLENNYNNKCEPYKLLPGELISSELFYYTITNTFNYTQESFSCMSDMSNGTTVLFYQSVYIPTIAYNISVYCDNGLNMLVNNNKLWSTNSLLKSKTDSIRTTYLCNHSTHELCCNDVSNQTCTKNCTGTEDSITGFQIKNPNNTIYNVYSFSSECHTPLLLELSNTLGSMINDDLRNFTIDGQYNCEQCITVSRQGCQSYQWHIGRLY